MNQQKTPDVDLPSLISVSKCGMLSSKMRSVWIWRQHVCFKEMIQLEGIPNLSGLVQSFDQQQLANFCRILSVTISEPDIGNDDKHTLLAKNAQQKRNACPSRAEVNQGRLGFMYRYQIGLEKKNKLIGSWSLCLFHSDSTEHPGLHWAAV